MPTIRQSVTFKASPHDVYELLMDSRKHAAFTGDRAAISRKTGGKFSACGDYITGKNLELVADSKIVQSWHASDWPDGHESQITLIFKPVKGGTRLVFRHSAVPDKFYAAIKQGWIDFYWNPMKDWLARNRPPGKA